MTPTFSELPRTRAERSARSALLLALVCAAALAAASGSDSATCAPPASSSVPSSSGLQIWPSAHPDNPLHADLVVAPVAVCEQFATSSACASAASIVGSDGVTRFVVGTAAALHIEAAESFACANNSASSPLSCSPASARAVLPSFDLQLWPAAHPANPQRVDLVVAPAASCAQLSPGGVCTTDSANQIVGADGVTRFVVGTAAAFHMEAALSLAPSSAGGTQSFSAADARAVPTSLGLRVWPAAHPQNPQQADLIVAPAASCAQLSPGGVCTTDSANQIVGADGVTRFVVGTAAAFHMEAATMLDCTAGGA
jgi:hypothetical protein